MNQFARTQLLLGETAMKRLAVSRVAVFGIGGVGSYACEALVRSGVGNFDLIDNDIVSLTNLNRQIIATRKTIGQYKTEVMKERMLDINPDVEVKLHNCFFLPETSEQFSFSDYDYVVDAVDTVTAKIALIMQCQVAGVPIISSMGAGNKLDASAFKVADIYETSVCPLAKVMRHELKKRGIRKLKVVYSEEKPISVHDMKQQAINEDYDGDSPAVKAHAASTVAQKQGICSDKQPAGKKSSPGSVSFVPSVAGLIIAGEVIKDLIGIEK